MIPFSPGLFTKSRPLIDLTPVVTITDTRFDPADAEAGYRLRATGDIDSFKSGPGFVDIGDWCNPKGFAGGNYECRMTVNSGSIDFGTTGSWLALSSDRTWTNDQTVAGTQTGNVTLEIRETATGVVKASKTFDITATVSP